MQKLPMGAITDAIGGGVGGAEERARRTVPSSRRDGKVEISLNNITLWLYMSQAKHASHNALFY
jgi:hypothetical protein